MICKVTPHIAVNGAVSKRGKVRKTAIDRRTTRHPGYAVSQRIRKRVEEVFGWVKSQAGADLQPAGLEGGCCLMRTAQGGAAGANIQHPLTSAYGTKREFSPERLKGRKPPHCRRSGFNVGSSPHN